MKMNCLLSGSDSIPVMFHPYALKMEEIGTPAIVVNLFKCYFAQLEYGAQAVLTENEIEPVSDEDVTHYDELESYSEAGRKSMNNVAFIKLNGGLGTSMGLEQAKSLLPVKDGLTFLDLILRQTEKLRENFGAPIPLLLMNSFKTHLDTMLNVNGFQNPDPDIPLAFVQHRFPKILADSHKPARWPQNPELEWNPPGHGDLYVALVTSGVLDKLLEKGYYYAFVSNSDNLGALLDERILGYMAQEDLSFVMEVARRTPSDKKGGHLTRLKKNGRLALRELAQCPERDKEYFSDINRHMFFNTNSLWLDLRAIKQVFIEKLSIPLDLIFNYKTVDPRDPESPQVIQVETAMGSAISSFDDSSAVLIPRSRFAPVKTSDDLFLVMSDCFIRTDEETIIPNPERENPMPDIKLDPAHYKKIDDLLARIPDGPPSLMQCRSLEIRGDFIFGEEVVLHGDVSLTNNTREQIRIPDFEELSGTIVFD